MNLDLFLEQASLLKKAALNSDKSHLSRGQKMIPKLSYEVTGKWILIKNYQALCKHTNRSSKFLARFFATKLGQYYELSENSIKIKGSEKLNNLKNIENLYYKTEVICPYCNSPDTKRDNLSEQVYCLSCTKIYGP